MTRLGELLVQNGVCSTNQVADAVRQQVVLGGRLGTNLVELNLIDEATLARYLAKQHGTPAIFGDRLRPDPQALELLSRSTVSRLNVIPYRVRGDRLQLLCLDPQRIISLEEVAAETGRWIDPIVVPEMRFCKLLLQFYRIDRGARGLTFDDDSVVPGTDEFIAPPTLSEDLMSESAFDNLYQSEPGLTPVKAPVPPTLAPPAPSTAPPAPSTTPPAWPPPGAFAPATETLPPTPAPTMQPVAPPPPPTTAGPAPPPPTTTTPVPVPTPTPSPWDTGPISTGVHLDAVSDDDDDLPLLTGSDLELVEEPLTGELPTYDVSQDSPIDFASATALLSQAQDRDAVARTVLRFARSLFQRALLFTVHPKGVVGWDAVGDGIDRRAFRKMGVRTDDESVFQTVLKSRAHYLGGLRKTPTNIHFLRAMGKRIPLSVFAMPVLVQGRPVNILYGDNGHKAHCPSDIGELLILALKISQSYEALFQARWSRASAGGV